MTGGQGRRRRLSGFGTDSPTRSQPPGRAEPGPARHPSSSRPSVGASSSAPGGRLRGAHHSATIREPRSAPIEWRGRDVGECAGGGARVVSRESARRTETCSAPLSAPSTARSTPRIIRAGCHTSRPIVDDRAEVRGAPWNWRDRRWPRRRIQIVVARRPLKTPPHQPGHRLRTDG